MTYVQELSREPSAVGVRGAACLLGVSMLGRYLGLRD
jgi:hypothetical protein